MEMRQLRHICSSVERMIACAADSHCARRRTLTTDANSLAAAVHDRMPVILPHAAHQAWLDPEIEDAAALQELLRPFPAEEMRAYPEQLRLLQPRFDERSILMVHDRFCGHESLGRVGICRKRLMKKKALLGK
jgi:SOS response associated peptidase (SRAP)